MNVLDLFSGIGGFSLGLERAGFTTSAFCEVNPYARAVLAKHWPGVPIYDDICSLSADQLAADGVAVDVVCGGFPCQDISLAGTGGGLDGERSGLWFEMLRVIAETRPAWVIAENVAALRSRGLDVVLRGLAAVGYDAEWHCIPAAAVGAPHRRDRVWIVARDTDAAITGRAQPVRAGEAVSGTGAGEPAGLDCGDPAHMADADCQRQHWGSAPAGRETRSGAGSERGGADVADADHGGEPDVSVHAVPRLGLSEYVGRRHHQWLAEPDVGRVADGIPSRVDRLRCLGNAVVPQIPEILGRAILDAA